MKEDINSVQTCLELNGVSELSFEAIFKFSETLCLNIPAGAWTLGVRFQDGSKKLIKNKKRLMGELQNMKGSLDEYLSFSILGKGQFDDDVSRLYLPKFAICYSKFNGIASLLFLFDKKLNANKIIQELPFLLSICGFISGSIYEMPTLFSPVSVFNGINFISNRGESTSESVYVRNPSEWLNFCYRSSDQDGFYIRKLSMLNILSYDKLTEFQKYHQFKEWIESRSYRGHIHRLGRLIIWSISYDNYMIVSREISDVLKVIED